MAQPPATTRAANLLRRRYSVRSFDDGRPITLGELARFLDAAARVTATWKVEPEDIGEPSVTYARRPYPSAGADSVPDEPLIRILNLSVARGGRPPAGASMVVDWLRVWRK